MSSKAPDSAKPEGEAPKEAKGGGGGPGAWLPLVVTVVLMPVLAYFTTTLVIIPKVTHARENNEEHPGGDTEKHQGKEAKPAKESKESGGHGKESKESGSKTGGKGKKQSIQLAKMVVNVAGSGGTRYLMSTATLVGTSANFKETIEENKDQLLDLASGTLGSKTISDLEKPGSRNQIRAELISLFNSALGSPVVQEIYFTEFAIQ